MFRRYRVVPDPGLEIAVDPCNADVTTEYADQPNFPYQDAAAFVTYFVAAIPLVIAEGGAGFQNGANGPYISRGERLLIGQRLKVTLAAPVSFSLDKDSTGSDPTCQWTVTGDADPFKGFYRTTINSYESTGRRENLTSGDLVGRQLLCSFAKQGTATVTLTAHIDVPPDALPVGGLDVSYSSNVVVALPTLTPFAGEEGRGKPSFVSVVPGRVALTYKATAQPPYGIVIADGDDPNGTAQNPSGITFRAGITTPSEFLGRKDSHGANDLGGWVWMQTVTEGSTRTGGNDGSTVTVTQIEKCVPPPNTYEPYNSGPDGGYPYSPTTPRDLVNVVDSGEDFQMFIANGVPGSGRDSPGEPMYRNESYDPDPILDAGNHRLPAKAYRISKDFTTWQMYKAPGYDSQWVPIQSFRWWFRAAVNWNGSAWTYTPGADDADHGFRAQPAFSAAVVWPNWSRRMNAGSLHYVTSN